MLLSGFLLFFSIGKVNARELLVKGWAWSSNIGWISFNCMDTNVCATSSYSVKINSETGKISGYAWSSNVGWISFDCENCSAKVEGTLGSGVVNVTGFARVLSVAENPTNAGGWNGWIRFDHGKENPVTIDDAGDFHGWAFADQVVGWISFNSSDPNTQTPSGVSYKVYVALESKPNPPSNLSVSLNNCAFRETSVPTFSWTYSDPDNNPQTAYEIEVFDADNNRIIAKTGTGPSTSFTLPADEAKNLYFGRTYSWQVRVENARGKWSDWSGRSTFSLPGHSYPWVNFYWIPQSPSIGQIVQFCSVSSTSCSQKPAGDWSECFDPERKCSFSWTFEGGNPSSSTLANPTSTFSGTPGSKLVTLKITDGDGFSCEVRKSISTVFPFPRWKEIPPFSWFFKFFHFAFSSLTNLFKMLQ